jgi:hypothetical protein
MELPSITDPLLTQAEILDLVFSDGARPKPHVFARMVRLQGIPVVKVGRKQFFQEMPVREFLSNHSRP